jgi:methyl-accepting chemotaxis protein
MLQLLKRLSIVNSTLISVSLFSFTIAVLAILSLSEAWNTLQQGNQDRNLLDLMNVLEKTAHHHAVERGLTAGYLAARNPEKKQKLQTKRTEADKIIRSLTSLASQPWPEQVHLDKHLSPLRSHLSNKSSIRRDVDSLSAPKAFAYYSHLNKLALDALQILRMNVQSQSLQQGINGASNLAWLKERTGQARGKINGVLSRGKIDQINQIAINGFVSESKLLGQYISNTLDGQLLVDYRKIVTAKNSKDIVKVHQDMLLEQGELSSSTFPSSDVWFSMASNQIGQIKTALDSQWQALHAQALDAESSAQSTLVIQVVYLVILILLLGVLNIHLVRSLKSQLERLIILLRNVAKKGDLTTDFRVKNTDELGDISRAIHSTINGFKDLIVGLAVSIKGNTRLGEQLSDVAQEVVIGAQSTETMATNIATAVEQMAVTSDEIARSAAQTLKASDTLNQHTERTFTVNQLSREAMQQLTENLQAVEGKASLMEEQVNTITSILGTINSLADQTNLLALNAAIEAARAVEQGRGFAVVADELRDLAKGSKNASDKISTLLDGLQMASQDVVSAISGNTLAAEETAKRVEQAQDISDELKEQAQHVESLSTLVATAAEQQSMVAREISSDASRVLQAAEEELKAAEEMLRIFSEMEANGVVLQCTVDQFKIN